MTGWPQLPPEIRAMVFAYMKTNYCLRPDLVARTRPASVCREWQHVFEPWTFNRLTLDQDRLADFDIIVSRNERRRSYVDQIALSIRLDEYDCTSCEKEEDEATIQRNDIVFINAVRELTDLLSSWERRSGTKLRVELGAYSPSDCKHTFRDFRLTAQYPHHCKYPSYIKSSKRLDGYPERRYPEREASLRSYKTYLASLSRRTTRSQYCPGWAHAQQGEPSLGARRRLLGTIGHPMSQRDWKFAAVAAVDELRITRSFYRIISAKILGLLLRESFTRIRKFTHEKWFAADDTCQGACKKEYIVLLSRCLPDTLERLRMFQDFATVTHPVRPSVSQDTALAMALAEGGRNLRTLSASFLVDAATFLPDFRSPINFPYFSRLTMLGLTAQCLSPYASTGSINDLLCSACCAIYQMPVLEVMQIWNAGRGYASYFTFWRPGPDMRKNKDLYSWQGKQPFVKFRSTWGSNPLAAVVYWEDHGRGLFLPDQPPKLSRDTQCLLEILRTNFRDAGAPSTVDDTCNHLWPYLILKGQMLSSASREKMRVEHIAGAA